MTGKKKLIELTEKECRHVSGGDGTQGDGQGFMGGGSKGGAMGSGH